MEKNFEFADGLLNFWQKGDRIRLLSRQTSRLSKQALDLFWEKSNLCEISVSGSGSTEHTGDRHILCGESASLRFAGKRRRKTGYGERLRIVQKNERIEVVSCFDYIQNARCVCCQHRIRNLSGGRISLEYVGLLTCYGLIAPGTFDKSLLYLPHNGWYRECAWKCHSLEDLGIESGNPLLSFRKFCVQNTGTWSTKSELPMGILEDSEHRFFLWQIESNNCWSYEIGDLGNSVTLGLSGANLQEHGFFKLLEPGAEFVSDRAVFTVGSGLQNVLENITGYRREISRKLARNSEYPVIFNEYLFASWCRPNRMTARALAPAAKSAGADVYVIDCGWHDEEEDAFDAIGGWQEGTTKYPGGLNATLDGIRSLGLKTGLWIEPECVGSKGKAKDLYPDCAFFRRGGEPVLVSNRYQLDFRCRKVRKRLTAVVDRIIRDYHLDYLKFDYNIDSCGGTEVQSQNLTEGLVEHARAYAKWFQTLTRRYPNVIFEGCASGGNRLDSATVSLCDLVSTSDQTNAILYARIVSNVLSAVLPEQAGIWSFPTVGLQEGVPPDAESVAFHLVNALVGRIQLAGKLYELSSELLDLVVEGVEYGKRIAAWKAQSFPYFPRGFSSSKDQTLVFGLKGQGKTLLFVYCLGGKSQEQIPLEESKVVQVGYPKTLSTDFTVRDGKLQIVFGAEYQARIFEIE